MRRRFESCRGRLLDLSRDEVHVWLIGAELADRVGGVIDDGERARAARLVSAASATLFVAAHGGLRTVLGRYLDTDPATLVFGSASDGKPYLESHKALEFNLAHSGELAAVVVAVGRPVGVDIEKHRALRRRDRVARRVMTPDELAGYESLDDTERATRFFTVWARKEALLKAEGTGIRRDLRTCSSDATDDWWVGDLEVPGYAAAVATRHDAPVKLQLRHLT